MSVFVDIVPDEPHRYGRGANSVTALGPVDLDVDPGAFLVLVGASGCGKSTLLRTADGGYQLGRGVPAAAPRFSADII